VHKVNKDAICLNIVMAFPHSHKTVFVLDHGPYFALPCHQVEFDVARRGGPGFIPLAAINKSVWTCAVEAVAEYCRIVWDIFPNQDRLLRVVVASPECNEVQPLLGWGEEGQTSAAVMSSLAMVGRPSGDARSGSPRLEALLGGIAQGLEALCEPSPIQDVHSREGEGGIVNRGRLVVITTLQDDRQLEALVRDVDTRLAGVNKRAAATAGLLPIANCELVIVHTQPGDVTTIRGATDTMVEVSPHLSTMLHTSPAGPALAHKLLYLCLKHYSLASTTVTGIPMKEEQNASSSANYDVELFHHGESHARLLGDVSDMTLARRGGCEYNTATLKWCTPRGSTATELHHCSGSYRITPTDVNSRQSSCLTNFLLSGRSVMLEMVKRTSNTKIISHMLTSHGGEIFIHTLSCCRSTLEDPPSISEGPGGRVTDYRIPDLAELMRCNRLAPWPTSEGNPGARARLKMESATRSFPYTISSTTVHNMPSVAPLLSILQGDTISEEQLAECRKILYSLINMEAKGDPLPGPLANTNPGKKGGRKDEQYRLMFSELERAVQAQSSTSARHHTVLECLMEVRNKPMPIKREADGEMGLAARELERYQTMTERERSDFNQVKQEERSMMEQSGSPAPKKARPMSLGGASMLDIWRSRIEREAAKKHREFAGRRNLGEVVKLYTKMEREVKEEVKV